ncbi:hypothetical protein [Granulicella sp. S156]|uniref:hypothetical protein n=1 Tax=Granulicella sp. S156 TaxID=1747224 RepID=UPI00131D43CB|nr:hypothetical protein [Granulicella sp. S156]
MKNRSLPAQVISGMLLAAVTLALTACGQRLYVYPSSTYSGRPIPPSGLLERVLVAYTPAGGAGSLEILDGLRNLRGNIQNTITSFSISGFSAADPVEILSFPEELTGYVRSYSTGQLTAVDYGTEKTGTTIGTYGADSPSAGIASNGTIFAVAGGSGAGSAYSGILVVEGINLNLPNVDKVVVNPSGTIILAMVRNSNSLYQVVKLAATANPVLPPKYVDCEPLLLPVYCVVQVSDANSANVAGAAFDRPSDAVFSLDGSSIYVLNCGPECGGTTASVTVLQTGALLLNYSLLPPSGTSPLQSIPVPNPIPVPGGVTHAISDGTTLYLAGQSLQGNGLFGGNLSLLNLSTYTLGSTTYNISDGTHTKMLFADNNTLWIGSQGCANGPRAAAAANGDKTQEANYNCLTRFVPNSTTNTILPTWAAKTSYTVGQEVCDAPSSGLCNAGNIQYVLTAGTSGGSTPSWNASTDQATTDGSVVWVNLGAVSPVQIIPAVTPNNSTSPTNLTVDYPNTNLNLYYYGDLDGICWVQNYNKIYTGYGGQIHAFNTPDGSEIDNSLITVQGTVLDVAYMDALTDAAN